ncbi:hypothetical protein B0H11DRAFT_632423 [Mycena galericulata]|nr:hypothetical protein B0H11DRAFT_632423 [Mycena galericulata]
MHLNSLNYLSRRLKRLLTSHSRRSHSISPQSFLPIEIWNCILCELPDNDLLSTSTVCRAFNALCIGEYLFRNKVPVHDPVLDSEIHIRSHILRALQLSCAPLPIQRLACDFWSFGIRRNLESLREVVHRSTTLREITLDFSGDLFEAYKFDHRSHILGATPASQREILRAFCAVLSAMALKTSGLVVVVSGNKLFTCRARDIASWRLDAFQFSGGARPRALVTRARRALRNRPPFLPRTTVRLHNGRTSREMALTEMHNAHVSTIHNPTNSCTYTLMIFNAHTITILYLYNLPITGPELTSVLATLTLGALTTLVVAHGVVNRRDLGEFILRHPNLNELCYGPSWIWKTDKTEDVHLASTVPIAHPGLKKIEANGAENINRVVEWLYLSPQLNFFRFSYRPTGSDDSSLVALNPAFRLLSQRSTDAHLDLWIFSNTRKGAGTEVFDQSFMDAEAAAIARTLQCIRDVEITCWSVQMGRRTLPWLALFPRLRSVAFELHIRGWSPRRKEDDPDVQAELEGFIEEAKAVLIHVSEVTGSTF